jgi:hypothetical protein
MNRILRFLALGFSLVLWLSWSAWAQDTADDSSNVVAAWTVDAGTLTAVPGVSQGTVSKGDQTKIWTAVKKIVPPSLLAQISRFEIFQVADNPNAATATDGYAVQSDDGQSFTLGLNLDSAKTAFVDRDPDALRDFEPTVVHELGHMLSFQQSQLDPSGNVQGTLVIDEGTLKPDSYLNLFYQKFWKTAYPNHGPATTGDAEGTALYNTAPDSFVTEYAATGPLEDFAESFARFVVGPAPQGNAIKDQKVKFFSTWPELTAMKTQMRAGLSTKS